MEKDNSYLVKLMYARLIYRLINITLTNQNSKHDSPCTLHTHHIYVKARLNKEFLIFDLDMSPGLLTHSKILELYSGQIQQKTYRKYKQKY